MVQALAVPVQELPHHGPPAERLHDLEREAVVGGEAHREAELLGLAGVGPVDRVAGVERVDPERADPEADEPLHGALMVLGDQAHLDDLAEEVVAERELAQHVGQRQVGAAWHGCCLLLIDELVERYMVGARRQQE